MCYVDSSGLHGFSCSSVLVRDDFKLSCDNGGVLVFEWSGWQYDSYCETFSLLDIRKLSR